MILEYLHDGALDCPLIRLYGNEPETLLQLEAQILRLASGEIPCLVAHQLPYVHGVNDIHLVLLRGSVDQGVAGDSAHQAFQWTLTSEAWNAVIERIQALRAPFEEGHQWLDETSDISVLCSRYADGKW